MGIKTKFMFGIMRMMQNKGMGSSSEETEYWKINGECICEQIRKSEYRPGIVLIKEYLNKKGKKRSISCLNSIDRYITRLIAQKLRKHIEPYFLPDSYAYQEGKGVMEAILKVKEYVETGYKYVAEIDIKEYFDSINLPLLEMKLSEYIDDYAVVDLIKRYLYCTVSKDGHIHKKTKGLLTGGSISPVLSNLYLHFFDQYVEHAKLKWVRYADNIYIFSDEFDTAVKIYNQLSKYLSEHFFLEINLSKSGVFKASERIIMGYDIIQAGNHVDIRKHIYREKKCYLKWHDSRLHTSGGKYHISDGIKYTHG